METLLLDTSSILKVQFEFKEPSPPLILLRGVRIFSRSRLSVLVFHIAPGL